MQKDRSIAFVEMRSNAALLFHFRSVIMGAEFARSVLHAYVYACTLTLRAHHMCTLAYVTAVDVYWNYFQLLCMRTLVRVVCASTLHGTDCRGSVSNTLLVPECPNMNKCSTSASLDIDTRDAVV